MRVRTYYVKCRTPDCVGEINDGLLRTCSADAGWLAPRGVNQTRTRRRRL
jgi:hypothetical protein